MPNKTIKYRKNTSPAKPTPIEQTYSQHDQLEAFAEDCDREMYGDDYDYLKAVGWLDR